MTVLSPVAAAATRPGRSAISSRCALAAPSRYRELSRSVFMSRTSWRRPHPRPRGLAGGGARKGGDRVLWTAET